MRAPAGVVVMKELREAVRDRRALASTLMYAVWGPLVMGLALVAVARDRAADAPVVLAVQGAAEAPALSAFLAERRVTLVEADPAGAVRARTAVAGLAVEAGYGDAFLDARPAPVALMYDGSWSRSAAAAERLRGLIEQYSRHIADQRLVLRGIAPSVALPVDLDRRDLSSAAARAAARLAMLPLFLLVAAFIGGMTVAADVTAGERERGSLEPLLLQPVSRAAIVAGKWGAAAAVSAATIVLTLLASHVVLQHPRLQTLDTPLGLTPADLVRVLALLLPLALFAPAVQVLVALFARSVREAQTQLSLLLFAPLVPGFLFAFGTWPEAAWLRVVPVTGHQLLVSSVLAGEPPAPAEALALAVLTVAAAALALGTTAALLGRERIVRGLRA